MLDKKEENYKKLDYLDDERSILGEKIYFRESFKGLWLKYEKKKKKGISFKIDKHLLSRNFIVISYLRY